jgi:hypothetical protein
MDLARARQYENSNTRAHIPHPEKKGFAGDVSSVLCKWEFYIRK